MNNIINAIWIKLFGLHWVFLHSSWDQVLFSRLASLEAYENGQSNAYLFPESA